MHIWNRPFYLDLSAKTYLRRAAWIGLFVFLFLWIFRPFGLNELPEGILPVTLGFGFISFFITAVLGFFISLILSKKNSENWTAGKEMLVYLIHLFCIGMGNVLFANSIGMANLSFPGILTYQFFTLAVGVFPVGIIVFIKETYLNNRYQNKARIINTQLEKKPDRDHEEKKEEPLKLSSVNVHEELTLHPDELLYVKASDNYVEVISIQGNTTRKSLLRNTLKNIDNDLKGHDIFFRCHKSYLVNLNYVNHLSGNAQGYKLHLRNTTAKIPVSRQYNETIKARLINHS